MVNDHASRRFVYADRRGRFSPHGNRPQGIGGIATHDGLSVP